LLKLKSKKEGRALLSEQPVDRHPLRTLGVALFAGGIIFMAALFATLSALSWGGIKLDSSVVNFYPLMAFAGAVFGFERWIAYESGGINPFHD